MKYSVVAVLLFAACMHSCTKSGKEVTVNVPATLVGKWNYTAYYLSIGGPGTWQPYNGQNKWIEFNTDGSFSSNLSPFNTAIGYRLTDSMHVQFITPVTGDSSLYYFFKIDTLQGTVNLSPARLICIEGCAQKFTKQEGK